MRFLPHLFANNRQWAEARTRDDPAFFRRLAAIQRPEYLWIGCSDSRVPANEIVGLAPGELFVHRNVANLVAEGDANCLSVIQYAVETLKVTHVIVTGHYGCGGVQASLGPELPPPLGSWLEPLRGVVRESSAELDALPDDAARWQRLCELNVIAQVRRLIRLPVVLAAWARGQTLALHGWIYDVRDGLLRDLGVSVDRA